MESGEWRAMLGNGDFARRKCIYVEYTVMTIPEFQLVCKRKSSCLSRSHVSLELKLVVKDAEKVLIGNETRTKTRPGGYD